ncbi:hypothetical protein [Photobacterium damselae]|uniref:Uncharacterized protein n=1 Tax=Photobacterium damselae subsp. damselae TaxID=85581 RepID=A0AAD3WVI1_PHODD|nr:hypothetical protein [Photobacterium damselae]KAB1180875.1 hypothetical protein F6450_09925 [Photobacterium damselae subsp. damselae]MBF7101076.1 hypothetical protein [Photobacterium damselae]
MSRAEQSQTQKAIAQRINELGSNKNEWRKAQFPYCTRRTLLAFAKFIDNPHAYENQLHDLLHCQTRVGGLQKRQRMNCVKVITVLMSKMDVENYQIGFAKSAEMETITHAWFMARYEQFWGETISLKRYYHTIHLLKMADYLVVDAVFVYDEEVPPVLDDNGQIKEEDAPRIYSKAAYKTITAKFMGIFGLENDEGVVKSKLQAVKNRLAKGLSNIWWVYAPYSYSYTWTKRQLAKVTKRDRVTGKERDRYPQGKVIEPDILGGNYLTEH